MTSVADMEPIDCEVHSSYLAGKQLDNGDVCSSSENDEAWRQDRDGTKHGLSSVYYLAETSLTSCIFTLRAVALINFPYSSRVSWRTSFAL